jgi:hypothetical protein
MPSSSTRCRELLDERREPFDEDHRHAELLEPRRGIALS